MFRLGLAVIFIFGQALPTASAQQIFGLSQPGQMIGVSPAFTPLLIKGLKIFPDNPLRLDFILDTGNTTLDEEALKTETTRLIKYFLASLTVPEQDLWVNLSPDEKDRVIPSAFGTTEMGQELLAQDYLLKQITASLTNPNTELGKKFWEKTNTNHESRTTNHERSTFDVPRSTLNRVWIVPQKAVVYENKDVAFVTKTHLKVMLEEDYKMLSDERRTTNVQNPDPSTQILREIILPEIEKEVNEGQNFAALRQIYNSLILATWFKRNLKQSILSKIYVGKNKVDGVDTNDPETPQKIYEQYLAAFKKGAYTYIKEEMDSATEEIIPRKYFSGGVGFDGQAVKGILSTSSSASRQDLFPKGHQLLASSSLSTFSQISTTSSSVLLGFPKRDGRMVPEVTEITIVQDDGSKNTLVRSNKYPEIFADPQKRSVTVILQVNSGNPPNALQKHLQALSQHGFLPPLIEISQSLLFKYGESSIHFIPISFQITDKVSYESQLARIAERIDMVKRSAERILVNIPVPNDTYVGQKKYTFNLSADLSDTDFLKSYLNSLGQYFGADFVNAQETMDFSDGQYLQLPDDQRTPSHKGAEVYFDKDGNYYKVAPIFKKTGEKRSPIHEAMLSIPEEIQAVNYLNRIGLDIESAVPRFVEAGRTTDNRLYLKFKGLKNGEEGVSLSAAGSKKVGLQIQMKALIKFMFAIETLSALNYIHGDLKLKHLIFTYRNGVAPLIIDYELLHQRGTRHKYEEYINPAITALGDQADVIRLGEAAEYIFKGHIPDDLYTKSGLEEMVTLAKTINSGMTTTELLTRVLDIEAYFDQHGWPGKNNVQTPVDEKDEPPGPLFDLNPHRVTAFGGRADSSLIPVTDPATIPAAVNDQLRTMTDEYLTNLSTEISDYLPEPSAEASYIVDRTPRNFDTDDYTLVVTPKADFNFKTKIYFHKASNRYVRVRQPFVAATNGETITADPLPGLIRNSAQNLHYLNTRKINPMGIKEKVPVIKKIGPTTTPGEIYEEFEGLPNDQGAFVLSSPEFLNLKPSEQFEAYRLVAMAMANMAIGSIPMAHHDIKPTNIAMIPAWQDGKFVPQMLIFDFDIAGPIGKGIPFPELIRSPDRLRLGDHIDIDVVAEQVWAIFKNEPVGKLNQGPIPVFMLAARGPGSKLTAVQLLQNMTIVQNYYDQNGWPERASAPTNPEDDEAQSFGFGPTQGLDLSKLAGVTPSQSSPRPEEPVIPPELAPQSGPIDSPLSPDAARFDPMNLDIPTINIDTYARDFLIQTAEHLINDPDNKDNPLVLSDKPVDFSDRGRFILLPKVNPASQTDIYLEKGTPYFYKVRPLLDRENQMYSPIRTARILIKGEILEAYALTRGQNPMGLGEQEGAGIPVIAEIGVAADPTRVYEKFEGFPDGQIGQNFLSDAFKQLSAQDIYTISERAAAILKRIEAKGHVHRDVYAKNFLFIPRYRADGTFDPWVMLTDFDIGGDKRAPLNPDLEITDPIAKKLIAEYGPRVDVASFANMLGSVFLPYHDTAAFRTSGFNWLLNRAREKQTTTSISLGPNMQVTGRSEEKPLTMADIVEWLPKIRANIDQNGWPEKTASAAVLETEAFENGETFNPSELVPVFGHLGLNGTKAIIFLDPKDPTGRTFYKVFNHLKQRTAMKKSASQEFKNMRTIKEAGEIPGLPKLVTAGKTPDGDYFLKMEGVAGGEELFNSRTWVFARLSQRIGMLARVAEIISDLQKKTGLTHYDLVPRNILINEAGEIMVGDLGSARAESPEQDVIDMNVHFFSEILFTDPAPLMSRQLAEESGMQELHTKTANLPKIMQSNLTMAEIAAGLRAVEAYLKKREGPGGNVTTAPASETASAPGGIDLNPQNFDIESAGEGIELNTPIDPAFLKQLETIPFTGFSPVILQIAPVTNLQMILGLKTTESPDQLTSATQ